MLLVALNLPWVIWYCVSLAEVLRQFEPGCVTVVENALAEKAERSDKIINFFIFKILVII
ncbi:MAG: hypothetical protein COA42_11685 [Alteromonadaceae bacterium]|nr:MAG: hypothetical protein COA42_11685 [Alteromonadaceae bacterium]